MPRIAVPRDDRPSVAKYVALTLAGFLLVGGVVTVVGRGGSPGLTLVFALAGAVVDVAILFVMIQSLIEEWFNAAEVAGE